eukprot:CAMPEP_0179415266 /NCGR_PEP_ID=MMETSP0799-20121207/6137_1 /TAXON_ID=46947 /ORGANISM="Geminigera cryophila, Strain CCMP2564" /LENGTH=130 /DNA_ID=CAMNT_0021187987 /DNA_START=427 /DNA_END=819 /DNA_ORIENTATION=+
MASSMRLKISSANHAAAKASATPSVPPNKNGANPSALIHEVTGCSTTGGPIMPIVAAKTLHQFLAIQTLLTCSNMKLCLSLPSSRCASVCPRSVLSGYENGSTAPPFCVFIFAPSGIPISQDGSTRANGQ